MSPSPSPGCCGITRRGFLLGSLAGLAAGGSLSWLGPRAWQRLRDQLALPTFTGSSVEASPPVDAMPGPFSGRVVQVEHPASVRPDGTFDAQAVAQMTDRGMTLLAGADHPLEAWRRFFQPGDVVGIKVNPVGRRSKPSEDWRLPRALGVISSPEVLLTVVRSLKGCGVRPRDILLFERYAEEFCEAGYDRLLTERDMDGVRWYASSSSNDNYQLDIAGFGPGRASCSPELARHVLGYDPEVFVTMSYAAPEHDLRDDRRYRSHLSAIVTRQVDKIINIPVLKDHRSAGVTLALKNMSHGMNNNVARSHLAGISYGLDPAHASAVGPNQCNTFIPTAAAQALLRQKMTLHILDGLLGVYEGGPGNWNRTWATWPCRSLFFATDPVALDHVGWDLIDRKRAQEGWRPVGHMGLITYPPAQPITEGLALLAAGHSVEAATAAALANHRLGGRQSEVFDRRTPEHIILAGQLGLGNFDPSRIEHRKVTVKS